MKEGKFEMMLDKNIYQSTINDSGDGVLNEENDNDNSDKDPNENNDSGDEYDGLSDVNEDDITEEEGQEVCTKNKGGGPFIGLDGCHLKGPYEGILLCAIAIDANYGVYPVALGVVEIECLDSWRWFLDLLHRHVGLYESREVCFMTDRQKGIIPALNEIWPNHKSRFCAGRNSTLTSGHLGLASTHVGTATSTVLGGLLTTAAPTRASGTITRVLRFSSGQEGPSIPTYASNYVSAQPLTQGAPQPSQQSQV
ncbi:hypothetical protein Ddye_009662 [Dipteronia dyeriana]|uniref:MULE transposase domain-containing protein n=1 Tax=Dipteronia dyeriana TaxID=168575 RepID=A0AAD9XBT9_9ROSI|nr:hypothetical protein Ddye_009662 [Dipteronia dyeriana]